MAVARAKHVSRWIRQSKFRRAIKHFNLLDVSGSSGGNKDFLQYTPPITHIYVTACPRGAELLEQQASELEDIALTILQPSGTDSSADAANILGMLNAHSGEITELSFRSSLSSPPLADGVLANLPIMNQLSAFSIDDCRLGTAGLESLSSSVLQAKHLRRMRIGGCHLSVDALGPLFEQIASLGHFESFEASDLMPSSTIARMSELLPHLPWLESLHFSGCFFSAEQVHELGTAAGQCQRLQSLQLRHCGLDEASGALLRRGLQQAPVLSMVDVSNNAELGSKGVEDLADGAQMMHMLHSLSTAHSGSGQAGVDAVASAVKSSRGLRDVDVGDPGADLDLNHLAESVQAASSQMHPWHGLGVTAQTTSGLGHLIDALTTSPGVYATDDPVETRLGLDVVTLEQVAEHRLQHYLFEQGQGIAELSLSYSNEVQEPARFASAIMACSGLRALTLGSNAGKLSTPISFLAASSPSPSFPRLRDLTYNIPKATPGLDASMFCHVLCGGETLETVTVTSADPDAGSLALGGIVECRGRMDSLMKLSTDFKNSTFFYSVNGLEMAAVAECPGGKAGRGVAVAAYPPER